MSKGPDVWVILDEAQASFLSRGGTVETTDRDGKLKVRVSHFRDLPPDLLAPADVELPDGAA